MVKTSCVKANTKCNVILKKIYKKGPYSLIVYSLKSKDLQNYIKYFTVYRVFNIRLYEHLSYVESYESIFRLPLPTI